ncbi:hypothetical protein ACJW30_05G136400 [Castanea mollissima]
MAVSKDNSSADVVLTEADSHLHPISIGEASPEESLQVYSLKQKLQSPAAASALSCSSSACSRHTCTSPMAGRRSGRYRTQEVAMSTYTIKHSGAIFPIRYGSIISLMFPSRLHFRAQITRSIRSSPSIGFLPLSSCSSTTPKE